MRRQVVELVEAVRSLGLRRTGNPSPRCVRIVGNTAEFPDRLAELHDRLAELDAIGGLGSAMEPDVEAERSRFALERLLKFIQATGGDVATATEIVAEALDVDSIERKSGSSYTTLPKFAPKGWKKKKRYGARLNLLAEKKGGITMKDVDAFAFEAGLTKAILGHALVAELRDNVPRTAPRR